MKWFLKNLKDKSAGKMLGILSCIVFLTGFSSRVMAQSASKTPSTASIDKKDLAIHQNAMDAEPDHINNKHLTVMHVHGIQGANALKPLKTKPKGKNKLEKVKKGQMKAKAARKHKKVHTAAFHHHR